MAQAAGYEDMLALADATAKLKRTVGLPVRLSEAGIAAPDLDRLVQASFHPLMDNNPRPVTPENLRTLYEAML